MSHVDWEPLENMGPVRRFVANWTVFIAAGIALVVLVAVNWGPIAQKRGADATSPANTLASSSPASPTRDPVAEFYRRYNRWQALLERAEWVAVPPEPSGNALVSRSATLVSDLDFLLRSATSVAEGFDRGARLTNFLFLLGPGGERDTEVRFVFWGPDIDEVFELSAAWKTGVNPSWMREKVDGPAQPIGLPPWASCDWLEALDALINAAGPGQVTRASVSSPLLDSSIAGAPAPLRADWSLSVSRGYDFAAEAVVRSCGPKPQWIVLVEAP